jgi:hypothetical protein
MVEMKTSINQRRTTVDSSIISMQDQAKERISKMENIKETLHAENHKEKISMITTYMTILRIHGVEKAS